MGARQIGEGIGLLLCLSCFVSGCVTAQKQRAASESDDVEEDAEAFSRWLDRSDNRSDNGSDKADDRKEVVWEPDKGLPHYGQDPAVLSLRTNCRSQDLDVCQSLADMDTQIQALISLHDELYRELDADLGQIATLLNLPESPPAATVTAVSPDTKEWTDPSGSYPTSMVIRLEYERGLNRLIAPSSEDVPGELRDRLSKLAKKAKRFATDWEQAVRQVNVELPAEVRVIREMGAIRVRLTNKKSKVANVPLDLLAKHLRRDVQPWTALASHVVSEANLAFKSVKDHPVAIKPALRVYRSKKDRTRYTIRESPAARERLEFTSIIPAAFYCQALRAEMRFFPKGATPPMQVVFRRIEAKE